MDWAEGVALSIDDMVEEARAGQQLMEELARHRQMLQQPELDYWNISLLHSYKQQLELEDGDNNTEEEEDVYVDTVVEKAVDQTELMGRYTSEAVSFLHKAGETTDGADPFFLFLSYNAPHTPLFPSDGIPHPEGASAYSQMVSEIDWSVGQVMEALSASSQLYENTNVVFLSDNGPWTFMGPDGGSPGQFSGGKGTTQEGGMRVSCVWWGKDVASDTLEGTDYLASSVDILTTFAAMAGVDLTAFQTPDFDGVDLSAVLRAAPNDKRVIPPRNHILYYKNGELQACRKGQYKLVWIQEGNYGMPPTRTVLVENPKLFDLYADVSESHDISATHSELIAEMEEFCQIAHADATERGDTPALFDNRLKDFREHYLTRKATVVASMACAKDLHADDVITTSHAN
jgi:arylsulfatase A-like enzyme